MLTNPFSILVLCLNITQLPIATEDKKVDSVTSVLFLIYRFNLMQVVLTQVNIRIL